MPAGGMSVAEVQLEGPVVGQFYDLEICQAELGSNNDYDDLLKFTVSTTTTGYFVRTWAAAYNPTVSASGGWGLQYLKCKIYGHSWKVYWFFGPTDVEIATNTYAIAAGASLTTAGIGLPLTVYFDQTYRSTVVPGSPITFSVEIDVTPMIKAAAMSNF